MKVVEFRPQGVSSRGAGLSAFKAKLGLKAPFQLLELQRLGFTVRGLGVQSYPIAINPATH